MRGACAGKLGARIQRILESTFVSSLRDLPCKAWQSVASLENKGYRSAIADVSLESIVQTLESTFAPFFLESVFILNTFFVIARLLLGSCGNP